MKEGLKSIDEEILQIDQQIASLQKEREGLVVARKILAQRSERAGADALSLVFRVKGKLAKIKEFQNLTLSSALKSVIGEMKGEFTSSDIKTALLNTKPRFHINEASVDAMISQFKQKGMLEVVKEGGGPIPNIYRKAKNFSVNQRDE